MRRRGRDVRIRVEGVREVRARAMVDVGSLAFNADADASPDAPARASGTPFAFVTSLGTPSRKLERDLRANQTSGDGDGPRGLVVAIRGVARADPEDLVPCQHASEADAVAPQRCIYYDAVTEQHLARQAVRTGEWIRDSQTVANITGEPKTRSRLEDDAGRAVNLHRASAFGQRSDAAKTGDWSLVVVHDHFQPASSGVAAGFLTNLVDMNMGIHAPRRKRRTVNGSFPVVVPRSPPSGK